MELDPMDEFEQELRQALERRPAPPNLKRKIMARRSQARVHRGWLPVPHMAAWTRLAAALLLSALLGGGVRWQVDKREEERKGAAAREQVLTALRITGRVLNEAHVKLAAHHREGE